MLERRSNAAIRPRSSPYENGLPPLSISQAVFGAIPVSPDSTKDDADLISALTADLDSLNVVKGAGS
jgi:hypothetical protein